METHQKDIEEKDPFGQNRADDEDDDDDDEKSFLKALLAERALKNSENEVKRPLRKVEAAVVASALDSLRKNNFVQISRVLLLKSQ